MKTRILDILGRINKLTQENVEECAFPCDVFTLGDGDLLACERDVGDSRYPYDMDGLILWAHSNGHIDCNESNLVIFRTAALGETPSIDFWGGIRNEEAWNPVSITGASKSLNEGTAVKRYTVFSKRAAYYIAETENCIFAGRCSVTTAKQLNFTVSAINKTGFDAAVYLASFMNPLLRRSNDDTPWGPLARVGTLDESGAFKIVRHPDPEDEELTNIAVINRTIVSDHAYSVKGSVALSTFLGGIGRTVFNASTLCSGEYQKEKKSVNTTDVAIASNVIHFLLPGNSEVSVNYTIEIFHDELAADRAIGKNVSIKAIEEDLLLQGQKEDIQCSKLEITFDHFEDNKVNNVVFNRFLQTLKKQVSLCALGKNSSGPLLGVRDVFQQITAVQIWNPEGARRQIVRCLNYIMSNGRPPRQFSIPEKPDMLPVFDIRQFVDQGLWIIETVHKYLSFTGDSSILEEQCSYYEIIDEKKALFRKSECVDSVLDHLIKITDFLIGNIDRETHCLKILFGDWNDAVDGLGRTEDPTQEFGTGVSVMATLQLYKATKEMEEILRWIGGYEERCIELEETRFRIAEGLEKNAIVSTGGGRHILHGWGDKRSYLVGSLCDPDGKCRYSATSNSFWAISGMLDRDPSVKDDILRAYEILDSKYGIKTFEPFFPKDIKGCGRIGSLTPGTFENSCAYVHCTTFAIMALFIMGEAQKAWEQIFKILPLTHEYFTKTPFVMPNSYCHNEMLEIDGESFGDWYTGSGAVLLRCIYEYALGIRAELDGLAIAVPGYLPTDHVEVKTNIDGFKIHYVYKNKRIGKRIYRVNGVEHNISVDVISGYSDQ